MKKMNLPMNLKSILILSIISVLGIMNLSAQTGQLPYKNEMSQAEFETLTIINANNDVVPASGAPRTWEWKQESANQGVLEYKSYIAPDDWFILPPIQFKQGNTYEITMKYKTGTIAYAEQLIKVTAGLENSVESQVIEITEFPLPKNAYQTTISDYFQPTADGDYQIGFHLCTSGSGDYVYVYEINIEEVVSIPFSVANLSLARNSSGNLQATLSWTNPSLNSIGNPLNQSSLSHISIFRDEETTAIHTINNPTIGEEMTWTDTNVSETGNHTYTITTYNGEYEGGSVSVSAWIGQAFTPTYINELSSIDLFNHLLVIDNNNDGKTWKWNSSGYVENEQSTTLASDEYLLTPPLTLQAEKAYMVTIVYAGAGNNPSYTQKLRVKIGSTPTVLALDETIADYPTIESLNDKTEEPLFSVSENGDYYIAFHCYTDKGKGNLKLKSFKIEEIAIKPAEVDNLSVVPDPDKTLKATLSWTNPTLNFLGDPLKQSELTKIEIYRNTSLLHTITELSSLLLGEEIIWTDETFSESGEYTYSLIPYNNDNAGEVSSFSVWVGNGLSLPYTNALSSQELFDTMKVIDNNNDNSTWLWESNGYAQYKYNSSNAGDDYLITPPLYLKAAGTYKLTFSYSGHNTSTVEKLEVLIGKTSDPDNLTTQIFNNDNIKTGNFSSAEKVFNVEEDGDFFIAFRAYSDKNKWYVKLKDISIEEEILIPGSITDLVINPNPDKSLEATLTWTNPIINHLSNELLQNNFTKIEILRNGSLVHTISNPTVGAEETWTDINIPEKGSYFYTITPYNHNYAGTSQEMSVWIGSGLDIPYDNSLATETFFGQMTVLDNNHDNTTWTWNSNGYAAYNFDRYNAADDYLFTPPLALQAGTPYKLTFEYSGSGTGDSWIEKLKVKLGQTATAEGQTIIVKDFPEINTNQFTSSGDIYFIADNSDDYFISLLAYSDAWKGSLKIKNISITVAPSIPEKVSDATIVPDENKALKASLSWTNPSLSTLGFALNQEDLSAIKIYRNNEFLIDITDTQVGAQVNWTDENVPAIGTYFYSIIPYNGDEAGEATILKAWIGGGLTLPYENNISQTEFDDLTIINVNEDYNGMGIPNTWIWASDGFGGGYIKYESYSNPNDWFITPPLSMEKDKSYKISLKYMTDTGLYYEKQTIKVMAGIGNTVDAQTINVAEFTDLQNGLVVSVSDYFTPEADNIYNLGFHLCSEKGDYIYIHGIKVEEITLDIDKDSFVINNKDTEPYTVNVNASHEWNVTSNVDWISIEKHDTDFSFSANENTGDIRTGEIVVTCDNLEKRISITQAGRTVDYESIIAKVGTYSLSLSWPDLGYENITYNVYRDDKLFISNTRDTSFIRLDVAEGIYNFRVSVVYQGSIESTKTEEIKVVVSKPSISISQQKFFFNELEQEVTTINIDANYDWVILEQWGDFVTILSVDKKSITFKCDSNENFARNAKIRIAPVYSEYMETIEICQSGPTVKLEDISYEIIRRDLKLSWEMPEGFFPSVLFDIYKNGELIVSDRQRFHYTDKNIEEGVHNYTFIVKYPNKATSTLSEVYTVTIDFSNIDKIDDSEYKIYPNPVKEGFYISGLSETVDLEIIDLNGKTLLRQVVSNGDYIPVDYLSKGIYILRINQNGVIIEKKIIKD